jgi:transposase
MPILVYRYGLRPPCENVDLVSDQIHLAHQYYNKLIEIERDRRKKVRAIMGVHPTVEPLEEEATAKKAVVDAAIADLRATHRASRSRSSTKEQRKRVKIARQQLKTVRAELRKAKAALKDDTAVQTAINKVNESAQATIRKERAICGCYWGTYLIIEKAVDAARKAAFVDPHFRRWTGHGAVAVQIQKGLSSFEALACDSTLLRIFVGSNPKRSELKMRVGTVQGKTTPIWATWPLILHRPLPRVATIKDVKVLRERLAGKDRWSVHFTLSLPDGWRRETCGTGTVAVDIGWRVRPSGLLRVAYFRDNQGYEEEILLEGAVRSGFRKVEDLRSTRDKNFNIERDWLAAWMRRQTKQGASLPDWLIEAATTLHAWRSTARLAALARTWRDSRFAGDTLAYPRLEDWRKQDKHLLSWEANQRDKSLARRKDQYRNIAARLSRKYHTLVLEQFDLSVMQRHVLPESDKGEIASARLYQRDAACSVLRSNLINGFAMRLGAVAEVNAAMTTQDCAVCGDHPEEPWDASKEVMHTCSECQANWDQDANAAHNLLLRWDEHQQGAKEAVPTKVKDYAVNTAPRQAKWAKRHTKNA